MSQVELRVTKQMHAVVKVVTHFNDPKVLAEISEDIGGTIAGVNCDDLVVRWADREGGDMQPPVETTSRRRSRAEEEAEIGAEVK